LRVFHSLLQAVGDAVIVVLGLDDSDGVVGVDIEDVVRPLGLFTRHQVAAQVDAPVGDLRLHGDAVQAPLRCDGWGDVMQLDVLLGHLPLRLNRAHVYLHRPSSRVLATQIHFYYNIYHLDLQ